MRACITAIRLLLIMLGGLAAGAANAGERWTHAPSGISIPDEIEGIARTEILDPQNGLDVSLHYRGSGETISIYVYRATYPNAALWFERAEAVLEATWRPRGLGSGGERRTFAFAGAAAPNGLRRTYPLSGQEKSTAVALAQVGRWLVKIRSTSARLNSAEQDARLDRVLAAIASAKAPSAFPLITPEPCPAALADRGAAELMSAVIAKPKPEHVLLAGVLATAVAAQAAGSADGLASRPSDYCRAAVSEIFPYATVYRPLAASDAAWILLMGDNGTSLAAVTMPPSDKKGTIGVLFGNRFSGVSAILFAEGPPAPVTAIGAGARFLLEGGPSFASVAYDSTTITVATPR